MGMKDEIEMGISEVIDGICDEVENHAERAAEQLGLDVNEIIDRVIEELPARRSI
jgi:antitoxin component of RelBE/YafQ-DinJ toxin-antitoxin module